MEAIQAQFRSGISGSKPEEIGFEFDEIQGFISPPGTNGNSFTALLELPPPQAVELLVKEDFPVKPLPPPIFPSNIGLIDRASKFSVFATADIGCSAVLSASSSMKLDLVKQEPLDSLHNSPSPPAISNQSLKSVKRKDREKKNPVRECLHTDSALKRPKFAAGRMRVKEPNKKSKKVITKEACEDGGEKLPYVHVRARRGQATDSHSLAERARREKINARMKLLQELVPGCNKISGTAVVLDEIINHVQSLQRQVEFLSMRIAAVNLRNDFNLDVLLAGESGSSLDNNWYPGTFTPSIYQEVGQINSIRQQQEQQQYQPQLCHFDTLLHQHVWGREKEDPSNFITPENSLLSHNSSAHSASLHSSQLKMEL